MYTDWFLSQYVSGKVFPFNNNACNFSHAVESEFSSPKRVLQT